MNIPGLVVIAIAGAVLGNVASRLIDAPPYGNAAWRPPSRPLMVTSLMAALLVALRFRFPQAFVVSPFPWLFVSSVIFTFLVVVITFINLDSMLIPDRLTFPGIAAGLVFAAIQGKILFAVLVGAGAAGLILAISFFSQGGIGGGDAKMAGMIGAWLGWPAGIVALFGMFIVGWVVALVLLMLGRSRKEMIPSGPAWAAGAFIGLFGESLARFLSFLALG